MSKLIKSTLLQEKKSTSVAIKVAPIFIERKKDQGLTEDHTLSIDSINQLLAQAKQDADQILMEANQIRQAMEEKIQQEKQAWDTEKQALEKAAREIGLEQGFQEGKESASLQYSALIEEAEDVLKLAKKDYHDKLDNSVEDIMFLSMKVAEKILGFTLDSNPEAFTKMVKEALKEVKEKEEVRIYTSPIHFPYLLENKDFLQSALNSQYELLIFPDSDLSQGGCYIDSSAGRMEVSIQIQLGEIKEHLLQLINSESNS
ncbi:flagellar assembly protein FliH [Bacillus sp. THAF10]|uniref:flagellar assembly protein FliH n=1 Tax=Bacillus sp. THAF10 TaxID=2587848 RepID=UPI001561FC98|nr:flagellar assembly protein FliH [Bacillus sp. THAF10]